MKKNQDSKTFLSFRSERSIKFLDANEYVTRDRNTICFRYLYRHGRLGVAAMEEGILSVKTRERFFACENSIFMLRIRSFKQCHHQNT